MSEQSTSPSPPKNLDTYWYTTSLPLPGNENFDRWAATLPGNPDFSSLRVRPWSITFPVLDEETSSIKGWGKISYTHYDKEHYILSLLKTLLPQNQQTMFPTNVEKLHTTFPHPPGGTTTAIATYTLHGGKTLHNTPNTKHAETIWEETLQRYATLQHTLTKRHLLAFPRNKIFTSQTFKLNHYQTLLPPDVTDPANPLGKTFTNLLKKLETVAMRHTSGNQFASHKDLHESNITEQGVVLDWGDTYITPTPFAVLFTVTHPVTASGVRITPSEATSVYLDAMSELYPSSFLQAITEPWYIAASEMCGALTQMDVWRSVLTLPDLHPDMENRAKEILLYYLNMANNYAEAANSL